MFGIGMTELLVILGIALIVFGPKRLPELAKHLGKAMREFKKATDEVKENIGLNEIDLEEDVSVFEEPSGGEKVVSDESGAASASEEPPSKDLPPVSEKPSSKSTS